MSTPISGSSPFRLPGAAENPSNASETGKVLAGTLFSGHETDMKRLLLALVVMILAVPPATPMPLVSVCCGEGECPVEDCRLECGTTSEIPPTTRLASVVAAVAGVVKAPSASLGAILDGSALAISRPLDLPNLSAGLRTPLRN
jgi:hypothetical protein